MFSIFLGGVNFGRAFGVRISVLSCNLGKKVESSRH